MIDSVAAAGTPDEVLTKLQAFVDAGARHFIFSPMGTNTQTTIDHLVGDVVPALREYVGAAPAPAGGAA
jgi:alkanesulfonate monooxygenase SsuD/methylene tetrahydromethanopterin reductase-like flavin-dependent oxidoreductase (luciferase family)